MTSSNLKNQLHNLVKQLSPLRVPLFLLLLVLVYAFVAWRIDILRNAQPSAKAVASQTSQSGSPHVDQALVNKITQLQDNNVNVQALFNQARQNPFQE